MLKACSVVAAFLTGLVLGGALGFVNTMGILLIGYLVSKLWVTKAKKTEDVDTETDEKYEYNTNGAVA